MDESKCRASKAELARQPAPAVVLVDRFFDGNDDLGSIGCNLTNHPSIEAFRRVLLGLLKRSDVQAIYAQIAEIDPGPGSWPFTDTMLVVGTIPVEELRRAVTSLEPSEVGVTASGGTMPALVKAHGMPVRFVWWD